MDLGSLELQIFVSLTVVLGGAFVALVCDYLKGNNEQLREHNIELRVRKEEQERRLLLDPAGFLGQWMPGVSTVARKAAPVAETPASGMARPAASHEMMQSFATPEALQEAESRASQFQSRGGSEPMDGLDVPPLAQRRGGRKRSEHGANRDTSSNGAKYADWVRPEVIARVARKAEAAVPYSSDIRDELEKKGELTQPEELTANAIGDPADKAPEPEKQVDPSEAKPVPAAQPSAWQAPVVAVSVPVEPEVAPAIAETRMNPDDAALLQKEIERVAQLDRQPLAPAPGTILRPLTVPSLRLEEEIQRVAEQPRVSEPVSSPWHSQLLEDVIAASAARVPVKIAEAEPPALVPVVAETVEMVAEAPALVVLEEGEVELEVAEEELLAEPIVATIEVAGVIPESTHPPVIGWQMTETLETPVVMETVLPPVDLLPIPALVEHEPETVIAPELEVAEPLVEEPVVAEAQPYALYFDIEPKAVAAVEEEVTVVADPPPVAFLEEPSVAESITFKLEPAEPPAVTFVLSSEPEATGVVEPEAPVEGAFRPYAVAPRVSHLAGMGISPVVDYLPVMPSIERPRVQFAVSEEPALALVSSAVSSAEPMVEETESLPDLLPLYSDMSWEPMPAIEETPVSLAPAETYSVLADLAPVVSEPPPFWEAPRVAAEAPTPSTAPEPIDISAARQPEPEPVVLSATVPDLLLPTGIHDAATWARLLTLPNPMTGILFVITLQASDGVSVVDRKSALPATENAAAIDKLMASFVREGDFGARILENEWVFVYSHDVAGFNQRRVGMISEKLWDFQLRHLGMANVSFKWGAVDVKSEPLGEAVQAARDRMNQTRRARKLPGVDQPTPRRVVNA